MGDLQENAGGRSRRRAGTLLLALALAVVAASSARAAVHVRAPGLDPAFRGVVPDYVIPCEKAFRLSVRTSGRTEARIGAGSWFRGHAAPLVNLRPGQAIALTVRDPKRTRGHWIRCLPRDFPKFDFKRTGHPSAPFYAVSPLLQDDPDNYIFIFDRWGVPVWWFLGTSGATDAKVLADGTIIWSHFLGSVFGADPGMGYELHRPDGHLVKVIRTVGSITDHHDLQVTPDGNYMLLSYRPRSHVDLTAYNGDSDATVFDGIVQVVSPQGKLLSQWSTADHIGLEETGRWWGALRESYDIVHANSVEPLANGDFLLSLRHTDAVYRVNGRTGAIEWKLGGTQTPQSLTVVGDPLASYPLGGQHDARMVDGTVSIHDNGTLLGRPPRAVRYRIEGNTATLVDSLSDPLATASFCCGSATYGRDHSWLLNWGGTDLVTEFDRHRHRTFRLTWPPGIFSYRVFPVRGELTRGQLIRGMNAQVPPQR